MDDNGRDFCSRLEKVLSCGWYVYVTDCCRSLDCDGWSEARFYIGDWDGKEVLNIANLHTTDFDFFQPEEDGGCARFEVGDTVGVFEVYENIYCYDGFNTPEETIEEIEAFFAEYTKNKTN